MKSVKSLLFNSQLVSFIGEMNQRTLTVGGMYWQCDQ